MVLDAVKAHYRTQGEPSQTENFRFSGHAVEVLKWDADKNPEQVKSPLRLGRQKTHHRPNHLLAVVCHESC
jgi:hypothetical protein